MNVVLPLRMEGQRVVLGMTTPDNVFVVDDVRTRLGVRGVKTVLVVSADIRKAIDSVVGASNTESSADDLAAILADVDEADVEVEQTRKDEDAVNLEEISGDENPVIRYVNHIIQTAVKEGASDIHIEPSEKKVAVRFRIDGRLFEMMNPPVSMAAAITSRIKIMGNMDISEPPHSAGRSSEVYGGWASSRPSCVNTSSGHDGKNGYSYSRYEVYPGEVVRPWFLRPRVRNVEAFD